jgi:hypothetical protein
MWPAYRHPDAEAGRGGAMTLALPSSAHSLHDCRVSYQ